MANLTLFSQRLPKIYKNLFFKLVIEEAQFKQTKFKIISKIHLLDSTTISLCLSLYDWAKYKTTKSSLKLHTLLDYDGFLPNYIHIINYKVTDNKAAEEIPMTEK